MKQIQITGSIWPDVDGNKEINEFLKRFGISIEFLLDDGIMFYYPETLEPYQTSGSLYFRDTISKTPIFHYYEDFNKLVFENINKDIRFEIPIYDQLSEFL